MPNFSQKKALIFSSFLEEKVILLLIYLVLFQFCFCSIILVSFQASRRDSENLLNNNAEFISKGCFQFPALWKKKNVLLLFSIILIFLLFYYSSFIPSKSKRFRKPAEQQCRVYLKRRLSFFPAIWEKKAHVFAAGFCEFLRLHVFLAHWSILSC